MGKSIGRFLFFFMPALIILYILFGVIRETGMGDLWPLLIIYAAIIGFTAYTYYRNEEMEEVIGEFEVLERDIEKSRFKIMEKIDSSFILKPKFDYPYSLFSKDRVYVSHSGDKAIITGPKYYVEGLVKDIRGDMNFITRILSRISIILLLFIIMIYPVLPLAGVEWDLKLLTHDLGIKVYSVDVIEFEDEEAIGNSPANINNQGIAVENEDYIFYVHDHERLIRTDKNFENSVELTSSINGPGIYYLNIIDDYLFYNMGDEYHRTKVDGSQDQTFYDMSYLHNVHIRGNWVYFINPEDDFTIYKMDINGMNLDKFLNLSVTDFTVHNDRLYFSYPVQYQGYGGGKVESISLDGYDRSLEFDATARDLVVHGDYLYYIGRGDKLYRKKMGSDMEAEKILDQAVIYYILTDTEIFYTHTFIDEDDEFIIRGNGLYRADLDGENEELLSNFEVFGYLNHVGDHILFTAYDEYDVPQLHRLDIKSGIIEKIILDYEVKEAGSSCLILILFN